MGLSSFTDTSSERLERHPMTRHAAQLEADRQEVQALVARV
jgi:hypothetical protein